jgi:hypothetical protein
MVRQEYGVARIWRGEYDAARICCRKDMPQKEYGAARMELGKNATQQKCGLTKM